MKKQTYKISWKVSPYRDKRTGVLEPVKRSEYAKQLFKIGAGWSNNK